MNDNELNSIADLIFNTLYCIENDNKTKPEKLELIKSIIIKVSSDQRKVGRNQILIYNTHARLRNRG